ncbi:hypothetical protein NQ176_g6237 [Zarea fungicola]|uniref:Uncharacterized protein n=1 Tax=Zarea fungicola TaxID=93591 RepID=A0ACC1N4A7_9HYPO|nr:hypothetical protein NQ176_g6237 [Lecanicillium fungicola]
MKTYGIKSIKKNPAPEVQDGFVPERLVAIAQGHCNYNYCCYLHYNYYTQQYTAPSINKASHLARTLHLRYSHVVQDLRQWSKRNVQVRSQQAIQRPTPLLVGREDGPSSSAAATACSSTCGVVIFTDDDVSGYPKRKQHLMKWHLY